MIFEDAEGPRDVRGNTSRSLRQHVADIVKGQIEEAMADAVFWARQRLS
jgi:hypothetical protein